MSIKKKIFGSLFIIVCLALVAGVYLWWQGQSTEEATPEGLPPSPLEIDLIDSPLEPLVIPETDFDIPSDFGTFGPEIPDLSGADYVHLEAPSVDIDLSDLGSDISPGGEGEAGAELPPGLEPDEATCAQFKAVPSCSFVPEQYRELCEKCKEMGY